MAGMKSKIGPPLKMGEAQLEMIRLLLPGLAALARKANEKNAPNG